MHHRARTSLLVIAAIAFAAPALAQGLDVPAKNLPVPQDVSPHVQKLIAAPLRNGWNVLPKTGEEWKPVADAGAEPTIKNLPGLLERMAVKIEKSTIDGVRVFLVTPATVKPENQNRTIIHMHGGCYVLNPREAGLPEAVMMAGFGGFKSIAVEYRMRPEAYFPAALDDGRTVYKSVLRTTAAKNIRLIGTSAGGALVLEMG